MYNTYAYVYTYIPGQDDGVLLVLLLVLVPLL